MVAKFEGGEIWIADGQFIVLGSPFNEEDPVTGETGHNCDALGCGSAHVVYRETIPTAQEMGALYDQKVEELNRGIAEGSTCYWCSEAAKVPLSAAKTQHFRTCEKSPLVQEVARLRELLREAREHVADAVGRHMEDGNEDRADDVRQFRSEIDTALARAAGQGE